MFIADPKSLFRFFDRWNDIPLFLREHGYEVLVVEPRSSRWTSTEIESVLQEIKQNCHVIADVSLESAIENFAAVSTLPIASITLVRTKQRNTARAPGALKVEDLKPARSAIEYFDTNETGPSVNSSRWNLEERFLELAISLAERDAQWSD